MITVNNTPEAAKATPFDFTKYPFSGVFKHTDGVAYFVNKGEPTIAEAGVAFMNANCLEGIFKGYSSTNLHQVEKGKLREEIAALKATAETNKSSGISELTILKMLAIAQDPTLAKELTNV